MQNETLSLVKSQPNTFPLYRSTEGAFQVIHTHPQKCMPYNIETDHFQYSRLRHLYRYLDATSCVSKKAQMKLKAQQQSAIKATMDTLAYT